MGTRGWTLSTFLGCCTWILHGLAAVAAVPVTTDGSFTVGTAFPMTTDEEWPRTTLTTEMSPTAADTETSPPWTETDPVTVTSEYGSPVPALANVTKAPNTTQSTQGSSAAPNTATTAAAITTQHPAVTPEAQHDELEATPDVPLGTSPVLEDVKDIPANRGEDTELSTGATSLHTTPPVAVTWVPEPAAGVTVLLSQGLSTAEGAAEEGVILPEHIQSEASATPSGPSSDAGELLPTQQDGAVGRVEGSNPEPAGEMAPAGEESPLASGSGDAGDATNGEFSTASSSHLPPESPVMSGTVENPENSSLLPGQALSPDTSLTPSNDGDGDGQGAPGLSSEASGSALSPTATPEETEDTATSMPAPGAPTDAQSDTNLPVSATALPTGDVGAVDLASPSLQPALTGEQPLLLPDALTSPTNTPSAAGAAYPAPENGASTVTEADGAAETPASPDLGTAPEAPVSPSLGESQAVGMPAGAPQEADGLGTGLSSDSDAPSPAPFVPDGLAWPTAGIQGQGAEEVGDVAQAGDPGDASRYEETQSDLSPPGLQPSASPADNGELLTAGTGDLAHAELSPPSALGDGTGTGGAPALGEVSSPGPAPPSSAGMEPGLSGSEGSGDLPGESASSPGAVLPPPGSVAGPVSEAETPASPDLSTAQGAPGSPSSGGSQPWGAAAGAPVGAGLPGAQGPDTDSTPAWGTPGSAVHGPAGPPSPGPGDQLGTDVGLPAAEGQGAGTAEQALEGAGSGAESEPPLGSTTGNGVAAGMDQVPGAASPSGIASPSDVVAAPSVPRGDEEGSLSSTAPGLDSLSPASPEGETGPGLGLGQGAESAGDVAQAGNPESENPNMETSASAVSPQQGELPGAGSSSGSASPSGDVAASSVSDPSSLGALEGAGSAAEALQPSLGAGSGLLPSAGEGASEVAGDGQPQAPARTGPAGSETLDGETGGVLQSSSSSSSTEGSSLPGRTGEAAGETSLAGAAGAAGGLNTGLEAAGPQEASVSAPGTQTGANTELSDGKLSEVDVLEVPGRASVNEGPSPGASLVPVAPDNSGVSDGRTTSAAASLLLPGHGLSSGLAPSGASGSAPNTQSGSSSLLPGSPGGLSEEAAGAQSWSLEDEVASGMPAPSGEVSPLAPMSPNAAPVLPSAPQRGNAAEGVAASPGLSTRESRVGSSAGGKGELGAAVPGEPALLLPPSGDADSPAPGEASSVLHGTMAGQGDVTHLLPSAAGSGAHMETHSPPGGSPGLPGLPPAGITAGNPAANKPLGSGPAGGSSPAALPPFPGRDMTNSLANTAPATSGSSLSGVSPGRGGSQGGSPAPAHPTTSCSPALAGPAPPAPLPRGREMLPRPGAAAVTSRASSPAVPAPPGGPAAAPALLPSPAVPAVPLYGYGARENDQEYVERRVDFNSPLFKPETGFPFGRTLRSSLYFTDNGQIIFPASDNRVLTYSNPPPGGFNGHEEVPMIAVFWDNADFSRGVGTTFYQEFSTLNTAKPPFVRDVEAKVRRYLRSSYSAVWTLKITWEKAPVYAARTDTRRTITYQAVLTTDGFRSYILMLYQDGGMQWDYTRLTSTNVLIGYTSGDGSYHNDDLTKRPPAAKYRPDQFRGSNTDLRGLWIYKLESRVGNNYRLKCLAWTGQQQEPRAWSQGLPTCPCSLQQGQQDPRFKSSRGGRWGARVSMLHSASPNQHGAGVRCLYDSQDQLIEGRQERYWRSSRQASPYRDQELKLYDWCCNRAGSAHLCARYSEKRPRIGCDGYQSPSEDSSKEAENDSDEQIDGEDK